ncbi:hypothetical protein BDZ97DRAFT_1919719 [Flammula alnicola]|nr:hypothetical protein BDZ97DRAFT_1919719 [Flammula alnicola]
MLSGSAMLHSMNGAWLSVLLHEEDTQAEAAAGAGLGEQRHAERDRCRAGKGGHCNRQLEGILSHFPSINAANLFEEAASDYAMDVNIVNSLALSTTTSTNSYKKTYSPLANLTLSTMDLASMLLLSQPSATSVASTLHLRHSESTLTEWQPSDFNFTYSSAGAGSSVSDHDTTLFRGSTWNVGFMENVDEDTNISTQSNINATLSVFDASFAGTPTYLVAADDAQSSSDNWPTHWPNATTTDHWPDATINHWPNVTDQ